MFIRNTLTPAASSFAITSRVLDAGPSVATIFVVLTLI
jgi:hypothetical protein